MMGCFACSVGWLKVRISDGVMVLVSLMWSQFTF